jgi:hypothetical protein
MTQPSTSTTLLRDATLGAVSGFIATAPMTVAMLFLHSKLPRREQRPLPPAEITARLEDEAGLETPPAELHLALTLLGHFGYGAACGALYTVALRGVPVPAPVRGVWFGLFVWTVSYLGWLPLARILPPATEDNPKRSGLMIAAHIVWGGALEAMLALLDRSGSVRESPGR